MTLSQTIRPATAFAALAILAASARSGCSGADRRRQAELRRHLERPDRHREGHLRPRLPLSGQDRERLGRLCGQRLVQRFRQGRRQRRRDRHGLARQPERHGHRPHVGDRRRRHLDRRLGRVLRHLERRTPLLSFSSSTATHLSNLQTSSPASRRAFFVAREFSGVPRCRKPAAGPTRRHRQTPAPRNRTTRARNTRNKAQHSPETDAG